jgi:hypothetical protein
MTGAQLAVFATLIAVVIGVWLTLFYLLPGNARSRFQYRAAVLRDECLDALLDGQLRRSAPVESFIARASAMAARPNAFTLTKALAAHLAMKELNCDAAKAPTYASLEPDERKLLHLWDEQLHAALGERLIRGSAFGWLLWAARPFLPIVMPSQRDSKAVSQTSAQSLAREYTTISEKMPPSKGRRLVSLNQ